MKHTLIVLSLLSLSLHAQITVLVGPGAPSSTLCATSIDVGKLWARADVGATAITTYVCAATALNIYSWLVAGGGANLSPVTIDPVTGDITTPGRGVFGSGSTDPAGIDIRAKTSGNIITLQVEDSAAAGTLTVPGGVTAPLTTTQGSVTPGHCPQFAADARGLVDSGGPCTGGGGGGGGAGGLTLVEEHTGTASTELDFTTCISATYDTYELVLTDITLSNSGATLGLQMSTNGGTSYDATSNYSWSLFVFISGATGTNGATSDTRVGLFPLQATTASWSTSGRVIIANPAGSNFKSVIGQLVGRDTNRSGNSIQGNDVAGTYLNTSAVNAFRLLPTAGTMSGTARCYGYAK